MKRPLTSIAMLAVLQGCASAPEVAQLAASIDAPEPEMLACNSKTGPCSAGAAEHTSAPVVLRAANAGAHGDEIDPTRGAPTLEGQPLTSVVVTQCNLVVAIYMTMPDGRLLRFDQRAEVPAQELVTIAYTASRSERVEVACDGIGAAGFEVHGAI
jgi:hypothetical protein